MINELFFTCSFTKVISAVLSRLFYSSFISTNVTPSLKPVGCDPGTTSSGCIIAVFDNTVLCLWNLLERQPTLGALEGRSLGHWARGQLSLLTHLPPNTHTFF